VRSPNGISYATAGEVAPVADVLRDDPARQGHREREHGYQDRHEVMIHDGTGARYLRSPLPAAAYRPWRQAVACRP